MFGSIPMQPSQQKDVFAHYLSNFREVNISHCYLKNNIVFQLV